MRAPRITDRRWRAFRAGILARDGGRCRYRYDGCTTVATSVDHLVSRQRAPQRIFDEANCFSVCHSCHRAKERRERAGEDIRVFLDGERSEMRPFSAYTHGKTGRDRRSSLLSGDYSRQAPNEPGTRRRVPSGGIA